MKWYEKPVRMMRVDYVQQLDRLKEMDLAELAREAKEVWHINCEWIIGTPGVAPGTAQFATFDTEKFPKYPPLEGFDLVREYLPHARKQGIQVLAYTNMHWFSEEFAAEHRDWEQKTAEGVPYGEKVPLYGKGRTFCVNTGWRDWAMLMIEENMKTGIDGVFLDGPVTFSGCCYCDTCKDLYRQKYGKDIPTEEDWRDDNWRNFIHFREDCLASFLADAKKTVEAVNPDGVVFLNAGNIASSGWRIARDNSVCAPHQHFNGAECFYHPGREFPLHSWSLLAKYLTAEIRPAVVFSHHTLGSWHYLPLPGREYEVATAQTVANGANPWFAVFTPALEADKERAVEPVERMNGFLERNEEFYTGTESAARVAVLLSRQTCNFYVSDIAGLYGEIGSGVEEGLAVDIGSGKNIEELRKRKQACEEMVDTELRGYCQALMKAHIPFDIVLDKHIAEEGLKKYELLILPGSACLSDEQKAAVERYVESGGMCIGSLEIGRFDEHGNPVNDDRLLNFFGVQGIEKAWHTRAVEEYLKVKSETFVNSSLLKKGALVPRPIHCLKVSADDGAARPVIFMNQVGALYTALNGESDCPALVQRSTGQGRTIYFPMLLGSAIHRYKLQDHEDLFIGCIENLLGYERELTTDAPTTVEVEVRRQREHGRTILHVVNMTGDMQRPMNNIVPLRDLRFSIRAKGVKSVYVLEGGALDFEEKDGRVSFTLPGLDVYCVVVLE